MKRVIGMENVIIGRWYKKIYLSFGGTEENTEAQQLKFIQYTNMWNGEIIPSLIFTKGDETFATDCGVIPYSGGWLHDRNILVEA